MDINRGGDNSLISTTMAKNDSLVEILVMLSGNTASTSSFWWLCLFDCFVLHHHLSLAFSHCVVFFLVLFSTGNSSRSDQHQHKMAKAKTTGVNSSNNHTQ